VRRKHHIRAFQAGMNERFVLVNIQPRTRNLPALQRCTSAASSTTGPRDVLIKNAVASSV